MTPLKWSKWAYKARDYILDSDEEHRSAYGYIGQAMRVRQSPHQFAEQDIEKAERILNAIGMRNTVRLGGLDTAN